MNSTLTQKLDLNTSKELVIKSLLEKNKNHSQDFASVCGVCHAGI